MLVSKRPVIGFASLGDPSNPNYSSGAPYAMREGFKAIGCDVVDLFPLEPKQRKWLSARSILHRLNGEFYAHNRSPLMLRQMARTADQMLEGKHVDFVFAPHTAPLTQLESDVPVVVTHDQTFFERIAYFAYEARPPAKDYVDEALRQEAQAFDRADLCVYPSQRSLDCIARRHHIPPEKLMLAPWGANLSYEPGTSEVANSIEKRELDPLMVTFVGVDWARKGGGVVVETCKLLRERGVNVRLLVIGCTPPLPLPYWVTVIPWLDKHTEEGRSRYRHYLSRSHLMFMPSRLEAYGHVLCEAAAYGVPAITTDVGGIPTVVECDVTGLCLPLASKPDAYAEAIMALTGDKARYRQMSQAARQRYETKLTWTAFCRSVVAEGMRLAEDRSLAHLAQAAE
jgi:glycosyltransferase involved in cell wall biosynthesis